MAFIFALLGAELLINPPERALKAVTKSALAAPTAGCVIALAPTASFTIVGSSSADPESIGITLAFTISGLRLAAGPFEPSRDPRTQEGIEYRITSATTVHSMAAVLVAFGCILVVCAQSSLPGAARLAISVTLFLASASFAHKVNQRVRKVCTVVSREIAAIREAFQDLPRVSQDISFKQGTREHIRELDLWLSTPIETGYRSIGRPLLSERTRERFIADLRRALDHPIWPDPLGPLGGDLKELEAACNKWRDGTA